MKKLIIALVAISAIGVASCNKDQQVVKELEGDWEEVSIDGEVIPDSMRGTLSFEYCKLRSDEWCTANYTDASGEASGAFEYNVSEKGTVLTQRITEEGKGTFELAGDIIELTETTLELSVTFFEETTTTVYQKK